MTNTKSIPIQLIKKQVQLLRVYNGRILSLFYLFAHTFTLKSLSYNLVWPSLALLLTYGLISISNYLYDQKIDQANHKLNPYRQISINQINQLYYICLLLIVIFILLSPYILATSLAIITILIIGFLYSHPNFRFSHHPLPKFISMSLTYTFIPTLLGIYPNFQSIQLFQLLSLCTLTSSYFLYSDIQDIQGDLKHHKYTIANTLGIRHTTLLSAIISSISYYSLLVFTPQLSLIYYLFGILPVIQWFIYINNRLIVSPKTRIIINYFWFILFIIWFAKLLFNY